MVRPGRAGRGPTGAWPAGDAAILARHRVSLAGRSWWSSRPGSLDGVPGPQRLQQARHQWGLDQRGRAEPFRFSRVVAGMKLAVADRGDVVSDLVRHVVRSGAADRAEQSADVDLQAGFLAHLAGHGLLDRLAGLQPAAGHGPQTLAGRAAAAYQQQPAGAVKHDRTRARHHWSGWLAADLTRLWSNRTTRAGRRVLRVDGWRWHAVSLTGCGGRAGTLGGAIGQGRWSLALRGGR